MSRQSLSTLVFNTDLSLNLELAESTILLVSGLLELCLSPLGFAGMCHQVYPSAEDPNSDPHERFIE